MANILLVDDHPDMREVVGQVLKMHGHTIAYAENGELAWEHMQATPPDVVVVDQRLPGITGIELLHRIRKTPAFSRLIVILYSGDDAERQAAKEGGAHEFWVKGSATLFDAVERLGKQLARD